MMVSVAGVLVAGGVLFLVARQSQEISDTTKRIEDHYETPAQDIRLVSRSELDQLRQEMANLKSENESLARAEKDAIEASVAKALRDREEDVTRREKISYDKGRNDALGLSATIKERIALLSANQAVINGECEAFGRGNRIDRVYPTNLPVEVLYWMVDPASKRLSGVVAINEGLLNRTDGPVTQIRCYSGKADIWPSFNTPAIGRDGHARPISQTGEVQETNPLLK